MHALKNLDRTQNNANNSIFLNSLKPRYFKTCSDFDYPGCEVAHGPRSAHLG